MKLKLSGMKENTMDKKYHMYDTTSPEFQDKEINIPDNEIIDNNILLPPTRKFIITFKPIDKKPVLQNLGCGDCICRVCVRNECTDNLAPDVSGTELCRGCNLCCGPIELPDYCPRDAFLPKEGE